MQGNRCCLYCTQITLTAASVILGVAIEQLSPETWLWYSDSIVEMGHGGKITDNCNNVATSPPIANETNHTVFNIIAVNPFKACVVKVHLVESRLTAIKMV